MISKAVIQCFASLLLHFVYVDMHGHRQQDENLVQAGLYHAPWKLTRVFYLYLAARPFRGCMAMLGSEGTVWSVVALGVAEALRDFETTAPSCPQVAAMWTGMLWQLSQSSWAEGVMAAVMGLCNRPTSRMLLPVSSRMASHTVPASATMRPPLDAALHNRAALPHHQKISRYHRGIGRSSSQASCATDGRILNHGARQLQDAWDAVLASVMMHYEIWMYYQSTSRVFIKVLQNLTASCSCHWRPHRTNRAALHRPH